MDTPARVAVITGASQGIGAGLVQGYRKLGYGVVANSRTIGASDDPLVLTSRAISPSPASASASSTPRSGGSVASTRW